MEKLLGWITVFVVMAAGYLFIATVGSSMPGMLYPNWQATYIGCCAGIIVMGTMFGRFGIM